MTSAFAPRGDNLPAELTTFIGRRGEVAEVTRLLGVSRLVTLIGPGGVGKTRLSLHLSADVRRAFTDGVWFVELAALSDPTDLADTVASLLGIGVDGQSAVAELDHFAERHALLVLDNCEHLIGACAELAAALLRNCPQLRILSTSREALRILGETLFSVRPMPVPDPARTSPRAMREFDCVALFAERAGGVESGDPLSDQDLQAIAEICYRLDGLPLAIEIAASRMAALSPQEILVRLSDPYRLLTGGSRSAPQRQRTLHASIEWSYELCTLAERNMWARLAVFAGGWELDAAEGTCGEIVAAHDEVLDLLHSLVDKSIIVRESGTDNARFRMLETIRQFGLKSLAASGDLIDARRRHRDWYEQFLLQADADWIGPRQSYWLARLRREAANIREALDFCLSQPGEAETALELTVPAWRICWGIQGRVNELRHWLDRILAATSRPSSSRARALIVRGYLSGVQREPDLEWADLESASAIAEQLDDDATRALLAAGIGAAAGDREAIDLYEQSLELLAGSPEISLRVNILVPLTLLYDLFGDQDKAQQCARQVYELGQKLGEKFECSFLMLQLGVLAWRRGELEAASDLTRRALRLKRELADLVGVAAAEQSLACIAARLGDTPRAATLLGAADTLWNNAGAVPAGFPRYLQYRTECERMTRDALGEGAYRQAFDRGVHLGTEQAIAWALDEATFDDGSAEQRDPGGLTPREREVAELVAQGLTNSEIAVRLVVAQRTAEGHVERILNKLGYSSRTQIAAWIHARR